MKKVKVVFFVVLICVTALFTEKSSAQGFYINASGGYGLQLAGQMITNDNTTSNGPNNFKGVYGSYGQGLSFGTSVGYQFSKQFSAEIDADYLIGAWVSSSNSSDSSFKANNTFKQLNYTNRAMMLRLIPAVKLSFPPDDFTPYIKAGVVIGLMPSITGSSTENDNYTIVLPTALLADTTFGKSYKYSGGTSIGGMAAVGVDINVADFFFVYAEFVFIEQTWAPTQLTYSAWTQDGNDLMPTLNANQKQINYSNSYSTSSPVNATVPSQALKAYQPFGSWGMNIGVRFYFGKGF